MIEAMRYSHLPKEKLIDYLLTQGREGDFWDFKQEWHEHMEDLIKDIFCFVNTIHDENCFLIIGIADNLSITGMSKRRRKQAEILDALSNLKYACDNTPQITVETIIYHGEELDILTIYNDDKTPVFLKEKYGKMRSGCIYARVGDKNTPNNGNAEIGVIENLWKKRFGLTKTPLDQIYDELDNKGNWSENSNGYYHIYRPEFTIERSNDDFDKDNDEYYSYAQCNEASSFFDLYIKANGTILEQHHMVSLDSGRLKIPVPEWGFICVGHGDKNRMTYKYYIQDSKLMKILNFMYDQEILEQKEAFHNLDRVVLLYKSEAERCSFEEYVTHHFFGIQDRIKKLDEYDYISTGIKEKTDLYKNRLRTALVLKRKLEEYRGNKTVI